jgi:hypothetical protein
MPQLVKVGALYERLGEEAVNEIAAWLDQVYDEKAELDALRRDVKEVLREVQEIRCKLNEVRKPDRSPKPS